MATFASLHLWDVQTILIQPSHARHAWKTDNSWVHLILTTNSGASHHSEITIHGNPTIEFSDELFEAELERRGMRMAAVAEAAARRLELPPEEPKR